MYSKEQSRQLASHKQHMAYGNKNAKQHEAIRKFVENYNRQWLIYRLGYKSLLEYREEYERKVA